MLGLAQVQITSFYLLTLSVTYQTIKKKRPTQCEPANPFQKLGLKV